MAEHVHAPVSAPRLGLPADVDSRTVPTAETVIYPLFPLSIFVPFLVFLLTAFSSLFSIRFRVFHILRIIFLYKPRAFY
ncbi:hypothetical protein BOTBODRAFT_25732 [Botryobasidium botryosum FD-172 SS1]|uniref:Uncharacterized protein n=1 Tax=Botryobasidium botryosum (strain FD-172 SS1) TaxID=930990 RepID=A0A067NC46_BOTB1|nr:hypothetical protein BOTBODRAFT_25732 [Botryobasidium botryosum FD-172 SS1]